MYTICAAGLCPASSGGAGRGGVPRTALSAQSAAEGRDAAARRAAGAEQRLGALADAWRQRRWAWPARTRPRCGVVFEGDLPVPGCAGGLREGMGRLGDSLQLPSAGSFKVAGFCRSALERRAVGSAGARAAPPGDPPRAQAWSGLIELTERDPWWLFAWPTSGAAAWRCCRGADLGLGCSRGSYMESWGGTLLCRCSVWRRGSCCAA